MLFLQDISDNYPELSDGSYLWYANNVMDAGTTLIGNYEKPINNIKKVGKMDKNAACSYGALGQM